MKAAVKKMAKNHIKRRAAPVTWPIARKVKQRWITKPLPGAHILKHSLAISVVLRELLKLANNMREIKHILEAKQALVNNSIVKDKKFGVGLFDTVSLPKLDKYYRVILTKRNKLALQEINKSEACMLPLKVKGKTTLNAKKQQINFTNGWNLLDKTGFEVNSVVLYNTGKNAVEKAIKLKPGCIVTLIAGKHVGTLSKLKGIKELGELKKIKLAVLTSLDGKSEYETKADYLFAIGDKDAEFTAVASK